MNEKSPLKKAIDEARYPDPVKDIPKWNRIVKKIAESAHRLFNDLNKKSDREIGELLLKEVWSDMESFSRKADIVDEACKRLRK